jgi:hypothetical protein
MHVYNINALAAITSTFGPSFGLKRRHYPTIHQVSMEVIMVIFGRIAEIAINCTINTVPDNPQN